MNKFRWLIEQALHNNINSNDLNTFHSILEANDELNELQLLLEELRDEAVGDDMPELATRIQAFL